MSHLMIINDYKINHEGLGPNNIMSLCDVLIDEVAMSHIQPRKETNHMNDSWDSAIIDEFKDSHVPAPLSKIEMMSKNQQKQNTMSQNDFTLSAIYELKGPP